MTTEKGLARYQTTKGEVALGPVHVRNLLCPEATDGEIAVFIRVCMYQRLNPFLGEAYLIKYDRSKPASIVVGKAVFTQRAEAHPQFDGFRAGIVVQRKGGIAELEGSMKLAADTLLGGWVIIKRKDRSDPFHHTVALEEYDTHQAQWRARPMTMIRKVALVQGLREIFPETFSGLYDASEMGGLGTDSAQAVIEGEAGMLFDVEEPMTALAPSTAPPASPAMPLQNPQDRASATPGAVPAQTSTRSAQRPAAAPPVSGVTCAGHQAQMVMTKARKLGHQLADGTVCYGMPAAAPGPAPAPEGETAENPMIFPPAGG